VEHATALHHLNQLATHDAAAAGAHAEASLKACERQRVDEAGKAQQAVGRAKDLEKLAVNGLIEAQMRFERERQGFEQQRLAWEGHLTLMRQRWHKDLLDLRQACHTPTATASEETQRIQTEAGQECGNRLHSDGAVLRHEKAGVTEQFEPLEQRRPVRACVAHTNLRQVEARLENKSDHLHTAILGVYMPI